MTQPFSTDQAAKAAVVSDGGLAVSTAPQEKRIRRNGIMHREKATQRQLGDSARNLYFPSYMPADLGLLSSATARDSSASSRSAWASRSENSKRTVLAAVAMVRHSSSVRTCTPSLNAE